MLFSVLSISSTPVSGKVVTIDDVGSVGQTIEDVGMLSATIEDVGMLTAVEDVGITAC